MKKLIFPVLLSILLIGIPHQADATWKAPSKEQRYTKAEVQLKSHMQELWTQHAWWTRNYIISNLAGIEDQQKVLERLLQNQVDIGNAIKPYYGEQAGNKLTGLLKEHIIIAGKIIEAAKKKDQANLEKFNKDLYRNADEIVAFLSAANPNWSKKELTDMFYTHLKFITDIVVNRLHKNWDSDIKTSDLNEKHLIHMAHFLTDGIVKQFPKKFK